MVIKPPESEEDYGGEEEESWSDDEDDEIMAAQRAEFAALWGISLTDMVDQKEDREFFELMSKIQVCLKGFFVRGFGFELWALPIFFLFFFCCQV